MPRHLEAYEGGVTLTVRAVVFLLGGVLWASAPAAAQDADPSPLDWHGHRPGVVGLVSAGALFGGALAFSLTLDSEQPRWTRVGDFDQLGVGMRAGTSRGEELASGFSHVFQGMLMSLPLAIQPGVVWAQDGDAGPHLFNAALLSYGMVSMAVTVLKYGLARARPSGRDQSSPYRSFPSGHAAMAFTGASLACTAHRRLPIYGSRTADAIGCGSAVGLAFATALLRLVSRRHHPSDVIAGAVLGILTGWLVPRFAYFGER